MHITPGVHDQQFLGAAECALAQIIGGRDQTWEGVLDLKAESAGGNVAAKITIHAEEVANSNALVEITFGGSNIP